MLHKSLKSGFFLNSSLIHRNRLITYFIKKSNFLRSLKINILWFWKIFFKISGFFSLWSLSNIFIIKSGYVLENPRFSSIYPHMSSKKLSSEHARYFSLRSVKYFYDICQNFLLKLLEKMSAKISTGFPLKTNVWLNSLIRS